MSLSKKMFLAFAGVVFLVVVVMSLAVNWSFQRGFNDYLRAQDQTRLDDLGATLKTLFVEDFSWQVLRTDKKTWRTVVNPQKSASLHPPPPDQKQGGRSKPRQKSSETKLGPPPKPNTPLPFEFRLLLLDGLGGHVAGSKRVEKILKAGNTSLLTHDIWVDNKIVGHLLLQAPTPVSSTLSQAFLKRQVTQLLWFGPIAILFALGAAALLMRYFLRPIAELADGAKTLTSGHYEHRIELTGEDELGQLAADFNTLAQTLETEERLRLQLVADTSHELRTPLAVLRSEIEAIQDGIRKPEPHRIAALHAQVLSLSKLVDDLHQLSLGDADLLPRAEQKVDLNAMLLELTTISEALALSHGLKLSYGSEGSALYVEADPSQLLQLFNNLLENSVRHTTRGGEVRVQLQSTDTQLIVCISDSAPSVPQESLPRLFDRLYRVDSSRNRGSGGSGLGLAIVEQISKKLGGSLRADHSDLGGLLVELKLPKYRPGR